MRQSITENKTVRILKIRLLVTMLTLVRPQSPAFVVMYAAALGIAFSPNWDETYTIRPHPVWRRKIKDVWQMAFVTKRKIYEFWYCSNPSDFRKMFSGDRWIQRCYISGSLNAFMFYQNKFLKNIFADFFLIWSIQLTHISC